MAKKKTTAKRKRLPTKPKTVKVKGYRRMVAGTKNMNVEWSK